MLSNSCRFDEFVKNVQADDKLDLMYLTEIEATEAERWKYRSYAPAERKENCGIQYAETLKNFLFYLRYGIRPTGVSDQTFETFQNTSNRFTMEPFLEI